MTIPGSLVLLFLAVGHGNGYLTGLLFLCSICWFFALLHPGPVITITRAGPSKADISMWQAKHIYFDQCLKGSGHYVTRTTSHSPILTYTSCIHMRLFALALVPGCIYIHTSLHVYTYTYVHFYTWIHTHTYIPLYILIRIYTYIHSYTLIHTHKYNLTHEYIHTHTFQDITTYTYIHSYTWIHKHIQV